MNSPTQQHESEDPRSNLQLDVHAANARQNALLGINEASIVALITESTLEDIQDWSMQQTHSAGQLGIVKSRSDIYIPLNNDFTLVTSRNAEYRAVLPSLLSNCPIGGSPDTVRVQTYSHNLPETLQADAELLFTKANERMQYLRNSLENKIVFTLTKLALDAQTDSELSANQWYQVAENSFQTIIDDVEVKISRSEREILGLPFWRNYTIDGSTDAPFEAVTVQRSGLAFRKLFEIASQREH